MRLIGLAVGLAFGLVLATVAADAQKASKRFGRISIPACAPENSSRSTCYNRLWVELSHPEPRWHLNLRLNCAHVSICGAVGWPRWRQLGQRLHTKLIPRGDGVFVGIRDSKTLERWFSGPLETVSIHGVVFRGVVVPVESREQSDAEMLILGITEK